MPPSSCRTDAASVTLPTYLYILIQKEISELGENKKERHLLLLEEFDRLGWESHWCRVEKPVEYLVVQVVLHRCWDTPAF